MKTKILIVDDSRAILHLLSSFLEKEGYEVATAEDGLRALDIMETFKPEIMFVDLIMPNIQGDKLCRIIRKMPEYDPVLLVIISAAATEEKIDFVSLGANACIAKGPLQTMLKSVSQALAYLQHNKTGAIAKNIYGNEHIFERDITKELLAAKKHFEVTLDNIDDGLVELTASGKITFLNKAAVQLLGLPEENLLSAYLPDIFPDPQCVLLTSLLERQNDTITMIGEDAPVIFNDRYLLIKFVPFYDKDCKFFITLIQDITRRKKAELKLQKNEQELEILIQERTLALEKSRASLQEALSKVKTLSGMLPICSSCKKIRDDKGYWNQIEEYIRDRSEAEFTHSFCGDCAQKLYPELHLKTPK